MKAILQRVRSASVSVDGKQVSHIGGGLVVLAGFCDSDDEKPCLSSATKSRICAYFPTRTAS